MTEQASTGPAGQSSPADHRTFLIWVGVALVACLTAWSGWRAFGAGEMALGALYCITALVAVAVGIGGTTSTRRSWSGVDPAPVTGGNDDDDLTIVRTLSAALDAVDPFTRGHSYRVSRYCRAIAQRMGASTRDVRDIEFAALLHDIGRTAIIYNILQQPGELTQTERLAVESHAETGYHILSRIPSLRSVAAIVRAHHEQPDGKGYPLGLSGDDIPLAARVIAVAGAFDSITSDRPFRTGRGGEEALAELRENAGTMFDAHVVTELVSLYRSGELFEAFDENQLRLHCSADAGCRVAEEFLESVAEENTENLRAA